MECVIEISLDYQQKEKQERKTNPRRDTLVTTTHLSQPVKNTRRTVKNPFL